MKLYLVRASIGCSDYWAIVQAQSRLEVVNLVSETKPELPKDIWAISFLGCPTVNTIKHGIMWSNFS